MRAAITMLEEEGFVSRSHGSGTYVTHRPALPNDLGRNFGVSRMIASEGLRARARSRRAPAPSPRRARSPRSLGVEEGERVSALRRVRTADGRRVVDVTDWCRVEHLAPEDLPTVGSIYAALAERGLAVDHGVAHLTPRNADGEVAERLDVPSGTLLLTIDQVDRTADGDRRARLARAPPRRRLHLHPAAARARRRRRGGALSAPLVVGVDVGSQGTCAQALEPDGTLVATAYAAARAVLSARRLGGAGPGGVDLGALVATLRELREATAGREIVALSFGSQLDGLVAAGADGEPLRPALIWSDRRAGEECAAVAARADADAAARADRLQPRSRPRGGEDRLAGGARAGRVQGGGGVRACPARGWPGGCPASWRSIPPTRSSTGLLDPRARAWAPEACEAFEVDVDRLPRVERADAVLGPVAAVAARGDRARRARRSS